MLRSALRVRLVLTLAALLMVLPIGTAPAGAAVDAGAEAQFARLINAERAGAGLGSLSSSGELVAVARRHSAVMAQSNNLHHNPNLQSQVVDWLSIGENVGQGPSVPGLHDAFMNSPAHRDNILYHKYTELGVGVEVVDGRIWVTVVFRKPGYVAEEAPAPAPEPEPEPAPAPEPDPEPASAPEPEPEPQPEAPQDHAPAPAADDGASEPIADEGQESAPAPTPPPPHGVDHPTVVFAQIQAQTAGRSVAETLEELNGS